MPQFITHNNKRYEVIDSLPEIGSLVIVPDNSIIYTIENNMQLKYALNEGDKCVIEIPIFTQHTLSSILIKANNIIENKKKRAKDNVTRFNRIRLTAEDFNNRRLILLNKTKDDKN